MEITDAAHKRAVEMKAALAELEGACQLQQCALRPSLDRAKKALLPIYEPLVTPEGAKATWGDTGGWYETMRHAGALYLEAAADRLDTKHRDSFVVHAVRDLRDWAKSERAIGS